MFNFLLPTHSVSLVSQSVENKTSIQSEIESGVYSIEYLVRH